MKKAEELTKNLLESFASQPEILPQSPDNVTWDTPGVGSIATVFDVYDCDGRAGLVRVDLGAS